MIRPLDRLRHSAQLPKTPKQTRIRASFSHRSSATRTAIPGLESGLDQVAGAVAHSGPEEEFTRLGGGSGAGDQSRDCVDDVVFGGAEGDGAAPGVAFGGDFGGCCGGGAGEE
jgi:hypothetical protein